MSKHLGNLPHGDTIPLLFDTFGGSGESITITGLALADIKVYRDGGTAQRSSTAGFTLLDTDGIDFDGITGIHGISIDTSDDTDAGFFAAGSYYDVVIDSVTVGGQTVSFILGSFRLVQAESVVGVPKVDVDRLDGNSGAGDRIREHFSSAKWANGDTWTTTTVTSANLTESDTDHWKGMIMRVTGGTYIGLARLITAFDPANDTLTFYPALPGTPSNGDDFNIIHMSNVDVWGWLGTQAHATSEAGVPKVDVDALAGNSDNGTLLSNIFDGIRHEWNTADSGTTTTLVDMDLDEADDFYNGMVIYFYSGANRGLSRTITDFDSATNTATFAPALTTAVTTEAYVLLPASTVADVHKWLGSAVHAVTEAGVPKVDVDQLNGDTSALGILQSIYNTIASQWRVSDSGTTTTLTDSELTSADTDDFVGSLLFFLGGANKNRARLITGFDPLTDTITFTPALPDAVTTESYTILPFGAANVEQWLGFSPNNTIADAILDRADGIETGLTFRQAMRLGTAVWTGKVSGAGTGTEVFRNAVADSKTRVTATVDALGNRTAINYDAD